jgi:hypothetical protein
VEARGKSHHFTVYLVPQPNENEPDGFEVKPRLTIQEEGEAAMSFPTEGMVQRIDKALPHMVLEAFIPAGRLGLEKLDAGTELRVNILVQSYYREMTMVWRGPPTIESASDRGNSQTVVLKD